MNTTISGLPHKSVEEQLREIYESEENHKKWRNLLAEISSFFWVMDYPTPHEIWLNEDGKLTRDESSIEEKKTIQVTKKRQPKNEKDFREIFDRELRKNPGYPKTTRDILLKECRKWLKELRNFSAGDLEIAIHNFIEFLEKLTKLEIVEITYEGLYKSEKARIRITDKIMDKVENGRFKGFGKHANPAMELRLIFKILHENGLFQKNKTGYGSKFIAQRVFYDRFGFKAAKNKEEGLEHDIYTDHPLRKSDPLDVAETELKLLIL